MPEKMEFDSKIAVEYDRGVRRTLPTYDSMMRLSQTFLRANLKMMLLSLLLGAAEGMS